MKAVIYNRKNRPDKLELREVDQPTPNDNEVLVKIHAVSLNAADYRSMSMGIIPKRKIFGADIAGRVEAIGANISQFKPGDEVLGDLASYDFGGLAEYVTAPEKLLARKPASISFEDAASFPMAAMTALQALRDEGKIQQGMKVLIVGCAGGVGTFAIQLAKFYGAEVTGVCSAKNTEQSFSLGADYVIDYTREDFLKSGAQYDLILGVNGNYPLLAYKKALKPQGIYVMVGGALLQVFKSLLFGKLLSLGSKKMKFASAKANSADLEFFADLLAKGTIKPVIDRRYQLDEAVDAMNYLKQGHSTGKVVIQIVSE